MNKKEIIISVRTTIENRNKLIEKICNFNIKNKKIYSISSYVNKLIEKECENN